MGSSRGTGYLAGGLETPPFDVHLELDGWVLFWTELELSGEPPAEALADLRRDVAERVRQRLELPQLSTHPAVAGMRQLFRATGCDPTRYRPASEALVRRLLKDAEMPAISPIVDINNCLSAELVVPCCAIADGTVTPPFVLRRGLPGESYESLRGGPFDLEGRPVLADEEGPFDVPITGSQRVKVSPDTQRAMIVSYLPAGAIEPDDAKRALESLAAAIPNLSVRWTGAV